jgi:hypothetical protein
MRQKLFRVLLLHRRKLGVSFTNKRLKSNRPQTFLENHGPLLRRRLCMRRRMRITPREQSIRDFPHLALQTIGWERNVAYLRMDVCIRVLIVALLERRQGEKRLEDGRHIATVWEYWVFEVREEGKERTYFRDWRGQ